jgi:hypothetical protein
MRKNTWGLEIIKVNVEEDKFESLLALNIGEEAETRRLFTQIKNEFEENNGEPDCIIDLLDEQDAIVEDISVTRQQAIEIAKRLGHEIN